jgi:hypothetical protein
LAEDHRYNKIRRIRKLRESIAESCVSMPESPAKPDWIASIRAELQELDVPPSWLAE